MRAVESHGLNLPGLEAAIERGARLVLTCDTGVSDREPVAYAQSRGVDVIVTDHHQLPEELPNAHALVNPQFLPAGHPQKGLPGVGVAYLLAQALLESFGISEKAEDLLDLAALGIVADLAVQTGDTRYLLQRGLSVLQGTKRQGLLALFESSGVRADSLNEETIGFALAPRLNALGRLGDANEIVDFLTTEDQTFARVTAARLEGLNDERRLITEQIFLAALAQLEAEPELGRYAALVLAQESWEPGVIGIVASRLVEHYHRPAVLLALDGEGQARGSARSIEGVDISAAIAAQRDLLRSFGGHPMAAGLALDAENIGKLRRGLSEMVQAQIDAQDSEPALEIDAYVALSEIGFDLVAEIERLAPFGPGNPALVLASRGLRIRSIQEMSRSGEHLRLVVGDEHGEVQEAVWWRGAAWPSPEGPFDLAFRLRIQDFRGERNVQIVWQDYRPAPDFEKEPQAAGEIELIDHRSAEDPWAALEALRRMPGLLIWAEGAGKLPPGALQRDQLRQAEILAVWTAPPGARELAEAAARVRPKAIALFGTLPEAGEAQAFLTRLAGLIRYAIDKRGGRARLGELAALTAQRERAVLAGLAWLQAKGRVWYSLESGEVHLAHGDAPAEGDLAAIEAQLGDALKEAEAYRRYYLQADPGTLVGG